VPEYATDVARKLDKVQEVVRHNLNDAWLASSTWYNCTVKQKSFEEGHTVHVYYPRKYKYHMPKWQRFCWHCCAYNERRHVLLESDLKAAENFALR